MTEEPEFYIEDAGTKMPRVKNAKQASCIICGQNSKGKRICDECRKDLGVCID